MAMVALAVGAVVRRRANPESVVTAAMLAAYLVGLGLSRVFVDHRIPLDGRILLPAQVLVIVLVGLALPDVALDARALAWGVASVCVVAIALDSQLWIAAHHRHVRYVQRRDAPLVLDGPPRRLPVPISPRD
jgi:hypothetical protein